MDPVSDQPRDRRWLLAVVVLCALPRLALWTVYAPDTYNDSAGYLDLANNLLHGRFGAIDGIRTPGYPLLLALGGLNLHVVWGLQVVLGVATAVLLYELTWRQTSNRLAALCTALGYSFSLNLLFIEACILSEALATFLLVLGIFLCVRARWRPVDFLSTAAIGVTLSLAALTRPLMLVAVPICLLFLMLPSDAPPSQRLQRVAGVALTVIVLVGGWCTVVWRATGQFTLTTLLGYNLSQHSAGFIELAPDEYAEIRDAFLRERPNRIAETGDHSMTIWWVNEELKRKLGLSTSGLSARLTRMSLTLFADHPRLYLTSVARSWIDFWRSDIRWRVLVLPSPEPRSTLLWAWRVQSKVFIGLKMMLLGLLVWFIARATAPRRRRSAEVPLFLLAIIASASILQALLEFGENARYAVPFQPLMICVVILGLADVGRLLGSTSSTPDRADDP